MAKTTTPVRTRWITIRMTTEEHEQAAHLAAQTTCGSLSEYARKAVLGKPVVLRHRNESLDNFLTDMTQLKGALDTTLHQFTLSVQRLHTLRNLPDIQQWILHNEQEKTELHRKIDAIQQKLNQAYELWSRA